MGILAWAVLGLIAGAIARAIYPGEQGLGILGTMVLGILFGLITGGGGASLSFGGVVVAVLGAIVTLFVYYAVTKRAA